MGGFPDVLLDHSILAVEQQVVKSTKERALRHRPPVISVSNQPVDGKRGTWTSQQSYFYKMSSILIIRWAQMTAYSLIKPDRWKESLKLDLLSEHIRMKPIQLQRSWNADCEQWTKLWSSPWESTKHQVLSSRSYQWCNGAPHRPWSCSRRRGIFFSTSVSEYKLCKIFAQRNIVLLVHLAFL